MSVFIYYTSIYIYFFWINLALCKTPANTWVYRYTYNTCKYYEHEFVFVYYMSIYVCFIEIDLTSCETPANICTDNWIYTGMMHICLYSFIICLYTFMSFESALLCAKLLRIHEYIDTHVSERILVWRTFVCIHLSYVYIHLFHLNQTYFVQNSCEYMSI